MMKIVEALQTLTIRVLISLCKHLFCWEDVEDRLCEMPEGWKLWPLEEELKKEWQKHQIERKKAAFKNVHQQLVSTTLIV